MAGKMNPINRKVKNNNKRLGRASGAIQSGAHLYAGNPGSPVRGNTQSSRAKYGEQMSMRMGEQGYSQKEIQTWWLDYIGDTGGGNPAGGLANRECDNYWGSGCVPGAGQCDSWCDTNACCHLGGDTACIGAGLGVCWCDQDPDSCCGAGCINFTTAQGATNYCSTCCTEAEANGLGTGDGCVGNLCQNEGMCGTYPPNNGASCACDWECIAYGDCCPDVYTQCCMTEGCDDPPCSPFGLGDLNYNGMIEVMDLIIMVNLISEGICAGVPNTDVNLDMISCNILDIVALIMCILQIPGLLQSNSGNSQPIALLNQMKSLLQNEGGRDNRATLRKVTAKLARWGTSQGQQASPNYKAAGAALKKSSSVRRGQTGVRGNVRQLPAGNRSKSNQQSPHGRANQTGKRGGKRGGKMY
jgi:hypothetical protein